MNRNILFFIFQPAPVQFKYVKNEIEIEVPVLKPELVETGCKNNFGNPVPCFLPGEARRKRSADEAPAAVAPLAYPYGGYPFYGGYGAFGAYPYAIAAPKVTIPEPIVKEIPVNTPVYKEVIEKVPIQPACQNGFGLPVPCRG